MSDLPPAYNEAVPPPGTAYPPPGAAYPPPAAAYPPPGAAYPPPPPGSYPAQQGGAYPPPPPGVYVAQPGYGQQKGVPPPGYQQVAGGQTVVVIQSQIQSYQPVQTTCPFCQQTIMTRVRYESGGLTWLAAGGIALMGCWLGCCLIPFCIDEAKDAIHECPSCNKIIAKKSRL